MHNVVQGEAKGFRVWMEFSRVFGGTIYWSSLQRCIANHRSVCISLAFGTRRFQLLHSHDTRAGCEAIAEVSL